MYTKDGVTISGKQIEINGCVVLNPTAEMLAENGWVEVVPPTPTAEEIAQQQREAEIWSLKEQLRESDYKAIKYAEGWITAEDYAPIKAQRQEWRERINELEAM